LVAGDVATERTSPDEIVRMITGDIGRIAARAPVRVEEGSRT
jgi:hypothetical protein